MGRQALRGGRVSLRVVVRWQVLQCDGKRGWQDIRPRVREGQGDIRHCRRRAEIAQEQAPVEVDTLFQRNVIKRICLLSKIQHSVKSVVSVSRTSSHASHPARGPGGSQGGSQGGRKNSMYL